MFMAGSLVRDKQVWFFVCFFLSLLLHIIVISLHVYLLLHLLAGEVRLMSSLSAVQAGSGTSALDRIIGDRQLLAP